MTLDTQSTPSYDDRAPSFQNGSGGITSFDPQPSLGIPMTSTYDSTRVFASAKSSNASEKQVSNVVYEFEVQSRQHKRLAVFYGTLQGAFDAGAVIPGLGEGIQSPWSTTMSQPDIGDVACSVASVRFADGSTWQPANAASP